MKEIVIIIGAIFLASCASVGAVIDGGKDLSMSVVDSTMKTAGNITNAALDDVSSVVGIVGDSVSNVVDNVVEEIDEQTDELQDSKPEEEQEK